MKHIFVALLLPLAAQAAELTVFAALDRDDASTYSLICASDEAKVISLKGSDLIPSGSGPRPVVTMMQLQISEGASSRIQEFAKHHGLKLVNVRIYDGPSVLDGIAFPEPIRNGFFVSILSVGLIPEKKNEPNNAMETTPVAVTIPATQEVVPATSVSHL